MMSHMIFGGNYINSTSYGLSNPFLIGEIQYGGAPIIDINRELCEETIQRCTEELVKDNTNKKARIERAREYMYLGKYESAASDYTFLLTNLDDKETELKARIYKTRALAYAQLKLLGKAFVDIHHAMVLAPASKVNKEVIDLLKILLNAHNSKEVILSIYDLPPVESLMMLERCLDKASVFGAHLKASKAIINEIEEAVANMRKTVKTPALKPSTVNALETDWLLMEDQVAQEQEMEMQDKSTISFK